MPAITIKKVVLPFMITLPWEPDTDPIGDVVMDGSDPRYRTTINAPQNQLLVLSPDGTEALIVPLTACIAYGGVGEVLPAAKIISPH